MVVRPASWHLSMRILVVACAIVATATDAGRADDGSDLAVEQTRQLTSQVLLQLRDEEPQALATLGEIADLLPSVAVDADAGLAPVAGAWNRQLAQLRSEERFDVLHKWSMPTDGRSHIRVLTSLVPRNAPPKDFARALGERPRSQSFPVSEINGVRGLFSSAWLLVEAGRETGRLNGLISELTELAATHAPGADRLLLLARVAAADRPDDDLRDDLQQMLSQLQGLAAPTLTGEGPVPDELVWQFGFTKLGKDRLQYRFRPYAAWTGNHWQGGPDYPNNAQGWSRLDAAGGHTDTGYQPIRRWVVPADGVLSISGALRHLFPGGDGVRGLVRSSRSGVLGEWTSWNGEVAVSTAPIKVQAWDTIDFVTDMLAEPSWDHFEWRVELALIQTNGQVVTFDSTAAAIAPRLQVVLSNTVLAAACFDRGWLQPHGERIASALAQLGHGSGSPVVAPFLREARAVAATWRYPNAQPNLLSGRQLKHWVVAGGDDANRHAAGADHGTWLTHEGHVMHLAGPRSSALLFQYPLTGDFEFSVEAQQGGGQPTDGCVTYNGLQILAHRERQALTIHDVDSSRFLTSPAPFVRRSPVPNSNGPAFNRLSIRSRKDGWSVLVNGHPVWTDSAGSETSPWLGLRAFGDRHPVFRNLRLTGTPVIPREVRLINGNSMRGWQSNFFNEGQPQFVTQPVGEEQPLVETPGIDWFTFDGTLTAVKVDAPDPMKQQSLLRYHRPLLNGESLTYEFEHVAGEDSVHPAIGRLAFLLDPSGVRLHWITDGEKEWTGLDVDNAILEPVHRRSAPQLKTDDWNQMQVSLADDTITLTLNGDTIYERPLEPGSGRQFGFFRNPLDATVRVRNVVLTGDWPQQLSAGVLTDLTAPARDDLHPTERYVFNAVIGEPLLKTSVFGLLQHAASLPDEERYRLLSDRVLPGISHPNLRVTGAFAPSLLHPRGEGASATGSQLVSPVFELIDTAARLGRLDGLRERVDSFQRPAQDQQRARLALLFLIDAARGDFEAASEACDQLLEQRDNLPGFNYESLWPETLVVFRGVQSPQTRSIVDDLFLLLTGNVQQWRPSGSVTWDHQMVSLAGQQRMVSLLAKDDPDRHPSRPENWNPGSIVSAKSHGAGYPTGGWMRRETQIEKITAHDLDLLHYRLPLTGDFDVECDVTVGARNTGLMFGGIWHALHNAKRYNRGDLRSHQQLDFELPLSKIGRMGRLRIRVRDGRCTTSVNGREIGSRQLPDGHDPWLAVYSRGRHQSIVSSLEITGEPVIPESVQLVNDDTLSGWVPYFDSGVGPAGDGAHWSPLDDATGRGISGAVRPSLRGSFRERLLQYYRPVFGDGVLEYEFLYEPGEVIAHPAIERRAILLDVDGVTEHQVTDGHYDRVGSDPANEHIKPQYRRGPATLPLREMEWNRVQLRFVGDSMSLTLNDELIYERPLDPVSTRTFGFFHFSDQTSLRVRNVVLRGDWPTSLPDRGRQELATNTTHELDQDIPRLKSVFRHSFAENGIDKTYFTTTPANARISQRSNGFQAVVSRPGGWMHAGVIPRFSLHGDFDVEVSFEQLQIEADKESGLGLVVHFADEQKHFSQIVRTMDRPGNQILHAGSSFLDGETRIYEAGGENPECEAMSGRLRLARRGSTLWYLFAAGDSDSFQIVAKTDVPTADTELKNSVQLRAVANGESTSSVVFRDVTMRAEKLFWFDESNVQGVAVMKADGTGFRQVANVPKGMRNLGSPEWSPDGKTIAFDSSVSGTPNSHIYTVNVDTLDVYDCGDGCMPSYSADGKRMVFTFPGYGIGTMDLMGQDRKLIERSGWSAMWSPNGKYICWGYGGNIIVFNVETEERTELLVGEQATMFSYTYWNPAWSHDSRWICFKGRNRQTGGEDIVVAAIDSDEFKVILPSVQSPHVDFAWHPDNKRVLIPFDATGNPHTKLYFVDRTKDGPPELLPGQPENWHLNHCNFSPDGKLIAVTGYKDPEPVEWSMTKAAVPSEPGTRE